MNTHRPLCCCPACIAVTERRVALLTPAPVQRIVPYAIGLLSKNNGLDTEPAVIRAERSAKTPFRVQFFRTNVKRRELVTLTSVVFGNTDQLMRYVDAYEWSLTYAARIRKDFLREHGLLKATDEQIDRYLDDHELSIPDPGRVDMPTLNTAQRLRIEGCFTTKAKPDFEFSFIAQGVALES